MDFNSCFNSFIQTGELIRSHEIQRFSWTFQMSMIDKNSETSDDFRCCCSIHPSLYGKQFKQQQTAENMFIPAFFLHFAGGSGRLGDFLWRNSHDAIELRHRLVSIVFHWRPLAGKGGARDLKIGGSREDRFYVDRPLDFFDGSIGLKTEVCWEYVETRRETNQKDL